MKVVQVHLMLLAVLVLAAVVAADPLPGQEPKFVQKPMIQLDVPVPGAEPTIYYGHDEASTAWWNTGYDPNSGALPVYTGRFMADDFADRLDAPVLHVQWWGSYINRPDQGPHQVDRFLIAFEADVPAGDSTSPYPFSHPDCRNQALNAQIVRRDMDGALMPGEGTFTETVIPNSNPNEPVYTYNAELTCPFEQQADTVYWLKIVALSDEHPDGDDLVWGWHNRDYSAKNDLASPVVMPGERQVGSLDPNGTPDDPTDDIPIYHFQDNAVSGRIDNIEDWPDVPCNLHMDQDADPSNNPSLAAEHYVDSVDGPIGISEYSKDLGFALYTPEPATLALVGLGVAGIAAARRRRHK